MTEPLRQLVDWTADYTLTNRGSVLRMAMSVPGALEPPAVRTAYRLGQGEAPRMTAARERAIALLRDGPPRTATEIARGAGVSAGVVRGLATLGAIEAVAVREVAGFGRPDTSRAGPVLSRAQKAAADALRQAVAAQAFSVTVLDGVTGSGKTEVYFEAIAATLDRDHPGAGDTARDRAERPVARPLSCALWGWSLRSGIPSLARGSGERPGAPSPRAGRRWWSARARRSGCPSAPSASSWSTRSTTPPSKQEDGVHLSRPRHGGGARALRGLPHRSGLGHALAGDGGQRRERSLWVRAPAEPARRCPAAGDRDRRPARDAAGARHLARPGPARSPRRDPGGRRAGAALPQPAGLCAAHALPRLRPPLPLPQLQRLAGRAPFRGHPRLPPLRPPADAAQGLPGVRGGGKLRGLRTGRRAARPRRWTRPSPVLAGRCSPAIRCAVPAMCRTWSTPSWPTRSMC